MEVLFNITLGLMFCGYDDYINDGSDDNDDTYAIRAFSPFVA